MVDAERQRDLLLDAVRAVERKRILASDWVYCLVCEITAAIDESIVHDDGCVIGIALRAAEEGVDES